MSKLLKIGGCKNMWIYEEEQKCLDEMAKYPEDMQEEKLKRKKIKKVLGNLFTYECEEVSSPSS